MTREEALNKAIIIISYFEAHFAKSKEAREDVVNIIEALEQEPKTGHWIEGGYDDYKWVCSECGYPRYEYYEKPKAKYCECCGCPMEIEPQESEE